MKTKDYLGIYWSFRELDGEIFQDEVYGLIFYGYWIGRQCNEATNRLQMFEKIWSGRAEIASREWSGNKSSSFSIDVKINEWPDSFEWMQCV